MLILIRWLARLPWPTLHVLGAALGWLGYALSGSYRRRLKAHAALAGLSRSQRRSAVAAAGRMVAELPRLWLRPADQALGSLVRWDGAELIAEGLRAGRGLVLLTPHLGCFEMCAQAIADRFGHRSTLTALYRPARQAWLSDLQRTARNRPGLATAPANLTGVRQMMRALRRGEAVGLLPDQVPPRGMGVWAPFFGRQAYTMTLASRLVQQTGAAWLLIWTERLPRGAGFVVHVSRPDQPLPAATSDGAGQQADAALVNRAMESLIRQCPGQYLWGYHRYKSPAGAEAGEAAP